VISEDEGIYIQIVYVAEENGHRPLLMSGELSEEALKELRRPLGKVLEILDKEKSKKIRRKKRRK
jgi:hypothetical protein